MQTVIRVVLLWSMLSVWLGIELGTWLKRGGV